jgi:hypothetical protein
MSKLSTRRDKLLPATSQCWSEGNSPRREPFTPSANTLQALLEPNVAFLNRVLGVRGVSEIINRAVDRLVGQLEHDVAVQIQTDLPLLTATLQARCAELPQLLETTREPGRSHAWST